MSHVEAAGQAEMEQQLEALLDRQLSAPLPPATSARPPPAPEPPAMPADVPCLEEPPRRQPQRPAISMAAAAMAASTFATFEGEHAAASGSCTGSPTSRQAPRGGLRASKSHRRIIGGVVRTPVPAASESGAAQHSIERAAAAPAPPAPGPQQRAAEPAVGSRLNVGKAAKHARHGGRESPSGGASHRGAAVVFRMDFDEPSLLAGADAGAAARGSSIAGRYEALGAELFSMQDEAGLAHMAFGESLRQCSSTPSAGQRASAMAMDLGEDAARSSSASRSSAPKEPLLHHQISKSMKRSPSGSLAPRSHHSPQVAPMPASAAARPKKQGFLPDLPSTPCSGSLAWTRRLNRPASRCALAGCGASAF